MKIIVKALTLCLLMLLVACAKNQEVKQVEPLASSNMAGFTLQQTMRLPISVNIQDGTADFHNIVGFSQYDPLAFILKNGQVITKAISSAKHSFFDSNGQLSLQYKNGILLVDYSPYNQRHSQAFSAMLNKQWIGGQTYNDVSTYGFANLRHATITVRIVQ